MVWAANGGEERLWWNEVVEAVGLAWPLYEPWKVEIDWPREFL